MRTIILIQSQLDFEQQFDRLIDILEFFPRERDPLSNRIRGWGVEVLNLSVEGVVGADLWLSTANKIDFLRNEILRCPITRSSLSDPVIEREWVWERAIHSECKELLEGVSPLYGKAMEAVPAPHLFAPAILEWVNAVKPVVLSTGAAFVSLNQSSSQSEVKRFLYGRSAKVAISLRQEELFRESITNALLDQQADLVEIAQLDQVVLAEARLRAQEHEAALAARLAAIDQGYKDSIDQIKGTISARQEAHRIQVEEFERRISSISQTNLDTAARLQVELSRLRQEHQSEVTKLNGKINQCTQDYQELKRNTSQSNQQLEGRVSDITQQLNQATSSLNNEVARNSEQAKEIERLRKKSSQQMKEISNLANKARNRYKLFGIF